MKNISTGAGLATLGLGIALHPLLAGAVRQSTAAPSSATAHIAAGPTVIWMGVSYSESPAATWAYHRLWSDGRLEVRGVALTWVYSGGCYVLAPANCSQDAPWVEVPPPPGGTGFACRTDINGDRKVDGADLAFVLNAWGQEGGCEPDATYPCLDLSNLAGGVAAK